MPREKHEKERPESKLEARAKPKESINQQRKKIKQATIEQQPDQINPPREPIIDPIDGEFKNKPSEAAHKQTGAGIEEINNRQEEKMELYMKLAAAACMEEEEDEDGGWWWWWPPWWLFTIPKEMFISCCC